MSSIQEREAELAALQAAFDEYITSSRELEEELDAELAKMRKLNRMLLICMMYRCSCVSDVAWKCLYLLFLTCTNRMLASNSIIIISTTFTFLRLLLLP